MENGHIAPLTWVCLHDEVRLACTDGRVVQGVATGSYWWGPGVDPKVLFDVTPHEGDMVIVEQNEIATVTPVGGYTDARAFVRALGDLVARAPLLPEREQQRIRLILDEHSSLEVEVTRERHRCSPPAAGR